ncbi:MAG: hypothetical protein CME06_17960 [Gemmatimonadetes bacterium]|nr:hypothetical protein [Gemmatimonadota bacterium]
MLVVSNVYPPLGLGGYEELCIGAVEGLRERGHDLRVLTSTYGLKRPTIEGHVHRVLTLETPDFHRPARHRFIEKNVREWRSLSAFSAATREFRPELVFFWNMGNLTRSLIQTAQAPGVPWKTAFYLSDDWVLHKPLDSWIEKRPKSRLIRIGKATLRPLLEQVPVLAGGTIRIANASFVSRSLLKQHVDAGVEPRNPRVIFNRVPIADFEGDPRRSRDGRVRLLYLGQILPHKGVHTVIEAMDLIGGRSAERRRNDVILEIVGPAAGAYRDRLESMIREAQLEAAVRIRGRVGRSEVAELLLAHDVLVLPSIWEEPFSVVLMEAMSTGIAVAGTTRGGSAEILRDGDNALAFEAEDPGGCARALIRLADDPELRRRLGESARSLIHSRFRVEQMVDEIEELLLDALHDRAPSNAAVQP